MVSYYDRNVNRCKKELLARLLTDRHLTFQAPYFAKALHRDNVDARKRLKSSNVVGIGFGAKETNKKLTGLLALRVYVERKLPKKDIPLRYQIPNSINGVSTDVIRVGRPTFHSRPAALGGSISHVNGDAGSIGCVVVKGPNGTWYLLSASHVLAPMGKATVGDQVVEPAASTGTSIPIAELSDFEPLLSEGTPNFIDAAIAQMIRKSDVTLSIPRIGLLQTEFMEPVLYQSVRKYGAATLHSLGIITDTRTDIKFFFNGEEYLLSKMVQVTGCGGAFSEGGDSGALVVDALSSRPVGIISGGAGARTYITPIGRILERFKVNIAQ